MNLWQSNVLSSAFSFACILLLSHNIHEVSKLTGQLQQQLDPGPLDTWSDRASQVVEEMVTRQPDAAVYKDAGLSGKDLALRKLGVHRKAI
ncbi:unnamed protein product [Heligmosomoides polygyrus]|uniref:Secreted protein n=1 Tax=Heligmosomoides polygyrus TaxID=6339 RepID=A0A183G7H2_HELPZ|nr:unnamed protein product [Heligmosomoides polygyrus]